ncbi:MAG: hypothetical protein ACREBC_03455, partial [Pyrinomonadaceae bacterium]
MRAHLSKLISGPAIQFRSCRLLMQSRVARRYAFALILLHVSAIAGAAIPLTQYHKQIQSAVSALDTLAQSDEGESEGSRSIRISETLSGVRVAVLENETVEWNGTTFKVDNSWLHGELQKFEKEPEQKRAQSLRLITERLQALEERLAEVEGASAAGLTKAEASKKLAEILQREEYARSLKETSALTRLLRDLWNWLRDLLPRPKPLQPGGSPIFTRVAQIVVILLALAVIAYAVKLFAPRLFQKRSSKKKPKPEPRIVLGEKLEPD